MTTTNISESDITFQLRHEVYVDEDGEYHTMHLDLPPSHLYAKLDLIDNHFVVCNTIISR